MRIWLTMLVSALLVTSMGLAAPTWTFDSPDEVAGWSAWNQVDFVVENGVLRTESTGGDPYFFPGGEWNAAEWDPFSGGAHSTIYLSVKLNTDATFQVYYVTEEDGGWGEAQRQNFDLVATGNFESEALVMERGGWQDHTVTHFRIDPGTAAGIIAEFDYISLESPVTPVESRGKLATTWAELRK